MADKEKEMLITTRAAIVAAVMAAMASAPGMVGGETVVPSRAEREALRRYLTVEVTSGDANARQVSGVNFGNGAGVTFYGPGQDSGVRIVEQDLRVGIREHSSVLGIAGIPVSDIDGAHLSSLTDLGGPRLEQKIFLVRGAGKEIVRGMVSWIPPQKDNFVTTIESSREDLGAGIWSDSGELVGIVIETRSVSGSKQYDVAIPSATVKEFLKALFSSELSERPEKAKKHKH